MLNSGEITRIIGDIPVTQKLGCDRDSIDSCILIEASVESIATVFKQYFELEVRSNCKLADYINAREASWQEVERQGEVRKSRPKKSFPPVVWPVPLWQYCNHQWTILPLPGTEESIAFALSLLLNANTITFYDCNNASFKEFKVFGSDRPIEHYVFGFECGLIVKDYWDISIEDSEFSAWDTYEHYFKSSVRQVTESEIRLAVLSKKETKHDRGFLDRCLKYYKAYIPILEETPYHYYGKPELDLTQWDNIVERMDIIAMPSDWGYYDRKVSDGLHDLAE